jgi:hypothetical protein
VDVDERYAEWVLAARIGRRRDGSVYSQDVLMSYGRPAPLAVALERAQQGRMVFVRREDAPAVLKALTGEIPQ